MQAVYFDMDGTIADLYGVDAWEQRLNDGDAMPYTQAEPLCDMSRLNSVCEQLKAQGVTVGVISWLAMGSDQQMNRETRKAKRDWLTRYLPAADEIHLVKYGTPKHYVCKVKDAVLVDDNADVRARWTRGKTINPREENISESLEFYLTSKAA